MSTGVLATAQFSIYKISYEEVEREFVIDKTDDLNEYGKRVVSALINSIVKIVKGRPFSQHHRVQYNGFAGVFFKTVHKPSWEGIAREIIAGNKYEGETPDIAKGFLENTNVSYVLFFVCSGDTYAVTGGYGSNLINKFIEKNFGLYLIPKVIDENNPVVKTIIQNNLLGNQTATQKTNKQSTSISLEQDMSSIFRQLNVEVGRDIAEELGIEFDQDEAENKKVNIMNKDSIVVRRSISISELKVLIENIHALEDEKDNFALNYLVLARKKRIKNADLFEKLLQTLSDKEFDRFILTGDDYTAFYTGADQYVLADETGQELIRQANPITFTDVVSLIPGQKYTKTALRTMLKQWSISTFDNVGTPILYKLSVFDAIQGFIEFGERGMPCYLFNGLWYVFDDKFGHVLTKEFEDFFDNQSKVVEDLTKTFSLRNASPNENAYNSWLQNNPDIIVSHTVLKEYVEIADAIFWDDTTIYLMHNKAKFDGSGVRDVTNQVLTSAEYLQQNLARHDRLQFLENYYDSIKEKYDAAGKKLEITKADFMQVLSSGRPIKYIIGYIDGYRKKSRATYAKYLTTQTVKKLATKGYSCNVLNISP